MWVIVYTDRNVQPKHLDSFYVANNFLKKLIVILFTISH